MIDFSWSHILLFLIIALVVVGPKDLPKVMRKAGQWMAKARNMADQFRSSFDEMARQSELDELRKEIDSLRNARPLAETERKFNEALTIDEHALNPDTPSGTAEHSRSPDVSVDAGDKALPPRPETGPAESPIKATDASSAEDPAVPVAARTREDAPSKS